MKDPSTESNVETVKSGLQFRWDWKKLTFYCQIYCTISVQESITDKHLQT